LFKILSKNRIPKKKSEKVSFAPLNIMNFSPPHWALHQVIYLCID
jgi:hypothetical protein